VADAVRYGPGRRLWRGCASTTSATNLEYSDTPTWPMALVDECTGTELPTPSFFVSGAQLLLFSRMTVGRVLG